LGARVVVSSAKQGRSPTSRPSPEIQTSRAPESPAGASQVPAVPNAEALTVDVLRRKLDAAIVAEQWDAVRAIRERIVEVEREAAGNVRSIESARHRR
jgi:hypothetical protein